MNIQNLLQKKNLPKKKGDFFVAVCCFDGEINQTREAGNVLL